MVLFELSEFIGKILDPISLIILALITVIYLYFKGRKKDSIVFFFAILISGGLIKLIKDTVHRARPIDALIQETTFSMPSGHVAITIIFFGFLAYIISKNKSKMAKWISSLVVLAIVAIVSFTRLYLRVHYVSDLMAGILLGGIILITSILASKKL
jgi:undecaprenyl-diphosphatase